MKHTHSTLRIIALLMLTFALCLSLTACGETACEHTYGEWSVKTAATCTAAGERVRTCTLCGTTESETVAATGHTEDSLTCLTCETELVAIDSLKPSTLPSDEARIEIENLNLGEQTIDEMILNLYMTEEGLPFAYGTATVTDLYGETTEMKLFYDEGTVYATSAVTDKGIEVDTTIVIFFEEIMNAYAADPSMSLDPETMAQLTPYMAMLEELEVWFNDYVLPLLGDTLPTTPTEPALPSIGEIDDETLRSLIETYFTVTLTEDGATLSLDYGYLKECNATLSEMSLSDVLDRVLGVGSTQALLAQARTLLALDVADFVEMIETNSDIDLSECDEAADALMAIVYGEGATMESVFGKPLSELLADDTVLATTVADLLCASLSTEETPVTEGELMNMLVELGTLLNDTKLYDLIATPDMPDVKGTVDTVIETLEELLKVVITVDAEEGFVSAEVKLGDLSSRITATLYNDKMVLSMGGLMMDKSEITVTYTAEKQPDMSALAAAKESIVYLPITAEAIVDSGFTPVYDEDSVTIIGATYDERDDDMAYVDTEWGYASYAVYTIDLTAAPVMVTCATYGDIVAAVYGYMGTYTLYEFEFEPEGDFDISSATPTTVTPSQEILTITVAPDEPATVTPGLT